MIEDHLITEGANEKAVLVGIITPTQGESKANEYLDELAFLADTAGATPHWCRHTFATRLHQAGADELAIKRMMGHSDKDVTGHYTHVDLDYLRRELCKVA